VGPTDTARRQADDAVEVADTAAQDREQTMNDTPDEDRTDEPTDIEDTEGHVRNARAASAGRGGDSAADDTEGHGKRISR
jgi:hypothetical protein